MCHVKGGFAHRRNDERLPVHHGVDRKAGGGGRSDGAVVGISCGRMYVEVSKQLSMKEDISVQQPRTRDFDSIFFYKDTGSVFCNQAIISRS